MPAFSRPQRSPGAMIAPTRAPIPNPVVPPPRAPTPIPPGGPDPLAALPEELPDVANAPPIDVGQPDFSGMGGLPEIKPKGPGLGWWLDQLLTGGMVSAMQGAAGRAGQPGAAAVPPIAPPEGEELPKGSVLPQKPMDEQPMPTPAPQAAEIAQPLFNRRARQYGQMGGGMVGPRA